MDLKVYYRKLREIEKGIEDEFVVVKSLATPDGGIAGRLTEVRRQLAARLVADGMSELATKGEAAAFRRKNSEEKKRAEEQQAAAKVQFAVLTEQDLKTLQKGRGSSKD